jgi:methylated-DNA-protein-cysteine methyltransferase related protein
MNSYDLVYQIVKTIPAGKVMTYGQIARIMNNELGITGKHITPRVVGFALHANKNSDNIPCHRVVNKEGRLASGYVFGGSKEQFHRLSEEGVIFKDENHVDLEKCLWTPPSLARK